VTNVLACWDMVVHRKRDVVKEGKMRVQCSYQGSLAGGQGNAGVLGVTEQARKHCQVYKQLHVG
jgi:hypothetical protein